MIISLLMIISIKIKAIMIISSIVKEKWTPPVIETQSLPSAAIT